MKVINNHTQPLTLDGGVVLATAGTEGSSAIVETLTDQDRRRADKGLIAIIEDAEPAVPMSPAEADGTNTEKRRVK